MHVHSNICKIIIQKNGVGNSFLKGMSIMHKQELIDTLASCKQLIAKKKSNKSPALEVQLVNGIKRALHSLKGMFGLLQDHTSAAVLHEIESTFIQDQSEQTLEHIGQVIQSLWLKETTGSKEPIAMPKNLKPIETNNSIEKLRLSSHELALLQEQEKASLNQFIRQGGGIYKATLSLPVHDASQVLENINHQLEPDGIIISTIPDAASDAETLHLILLIGNQKKPNITLNSAALDCSELIQPNAALAKELMPHKQQQDTQSNAPAEYTSADQTVAADFNPNEATFEHEQNIGRRILNIPFVSIHKLIKQSSKLIQLIKKARKSTQQESQEIQELMHDIDHNARRYHESLVKTRLNKAESITPHLQQLLNALANQLGKSCTLTIEGGETLIDADILNDIDTMLVHLIKNALDHGIETSDIRISQGKQAQGSITIRFQSADTGVVIQLSDDGKGIDFDALQAKALEKKLISQEQALTATPDQIMQFIFHPGFSTKKTVSSTSGRGVGMDVVKQTIEKLRGTISIKTEANQGTTFTLKIPSNSILVRLLRVSCLEKHFALPLGYVEHVFVCDKSHISNVDNKTIYSYEGTILPTIFLHKLIDTDWQIDPAAEYFALLIKYGEQLFILCIDQLLGHEETLIMPIGDNVHESYNKLLAGHADFGDDMLVLVLHVSHLSELAGHGETTTQA